MAHDRSRRPVGDHLAVGEHDDPVGHFGDELDVVGRHDDAMTTGGQSAQVVRQPFLGAVVEAAGGLVEQHQRRLRRQHECQRDGEPLALGEVLRMGTRDDPGNERLEHRPSRSFWQSAVMITGAALEVHGLGAKQRARILRHQSDEPDGLRRRQHRGLTPEDVHRASFGGAAVRRDGGGGLTCRLRFCP